MSFTDFPDVKLKVIPTFGTPGPQGVQGVPGAPGAVGPPGPTGATGGTFPDAPSNGNTYGRVNGAWTQVLPWQNLPPACDFNTVLTPGMYSTQDATSTNTPVAGRYWYLEVNAYANDPAHYVRQKATLLDNNTTSLLTIYERVMGASVWTAWRLVAFADSPTFTGDPKAPTPAPGDNDTSIATTAFVTGAISGALVNYLPLAGGTMSGPINAPVKGHTFGQASGTVATSAPTPADANILLYNFSPTNWAGYGSDSAGNIWFKVGTSGSPLPAFWLGAGDLTARFSNPPLAPTPAIADLSQKMATTAFVNYAQVIGASVDLNTIKAPGTYACGNNTCTNGPTVGGQWYIEVLVYGNDPTHYLMQVAYDLLGTGNTWTRTLISGAWQPWVPLGSGGGTGRPLLTANRSYFVDTVNGLDTNNGLAAGAGNAWKTIGKAMTVAGALDTGSFQLTINVAAGTYVENVVLPKMVGALPPILIGVGSTTIVQNTGTNNHAILNDAAGSWIVQNMKLIGNSSAGGSCMIAQNGGVIKMGGCEFGAAGSGGFHMQGLYGGAISFIAPYTISGSAQGHMITNFGSITTNGAAGTATVVGALTFSFAFACANRVGLILALGYSATGGSVTGQRYVVGANSVIDTGGGGANVFPGTIAGTPVAGTPGTTGGQYI